MNIGTSVVGSIRSESSMILQTVKAEWLKRTANVLADLRQVMLEAISISLSGHLILREAHANKCAKLSFSNYV